MMSYTKFTLLIIFSILTGVGCQPKGETQVTGMVRDSVTLSPIPYAKMNIFKVYNKGIFSSGESVEDVAYINADANGYFSFQKELKKSSYYITASSDDHISRTKKIGWGRAEKIDFLLKPRVGQLEIRFFLSEKDTLFLKVRSKSVLYLEKKLVRYVDEESVTIPINGDEDIFIDWCGYNRCFKDSVFCPAKRTTVFNTYF